MVIVKMAAVCNGVDCLNFFRIEEHYMVDTIMTMWKQENNTVLVITVGDLYRPKENYVI